jgi:hypothetical protein
MRRTAETLDDWRDRAQWCDRHVRHGGFLLRGNALAMRVASDTYDSRRLTRQAPRRREEGRRRFHPASQLWRRAAEARDLRRDDREDSVLARSRHHRSRAPARVPVRRAGLSVWPDQPLAFELSAVEEGIHRPWRRWIDTDQDAPHDVYDWPGGPVVQGPSCSVQARSLVVLFAQREDVRPPVTSCVGSQRPACAPPVAHRPHTSTIWPRTMPIDQRWRRS